MDRTINKLGWLLAALVSVAVIASFAGLVAVMFLFVAGSGRADAAQSSTGTDAISAGGYHTCALKDGGARCWGYNFYGQVGDGTTTNSSVPVAVSGLGSGVSAISAGQYHTCALKDGGARCWGANFAGQLGNGTNIGPQFCSRASCSTTPVTVSGLVSGVSAISVGADGLYTCALRDGGVWCWGDNEFGQLGDGTTTNRSVPVAVSGLGSGVAAISAGVDHTCALKDGGVWCWGENDVGELGDGTRASSSVPVAVSGLGSGVSAISAGDLHTCALKHGGVWCWGYNFYGELGDGTPGPQFCSGYPCGTVPVAVSGLRSGVSAISAAFEHTCALKHGGAWCWGANFFGQLGDGTTTESRVPVAVSGLGRGVSAISAGDNHTCALKHGGAWCWGDNGYGELGDGTTTNSSVPVAVVWPATNTPTP